MEVRLFRPLKLAAVHGDRGQFAWVSQLTSGVALGAWLGAWGFALAAAQKDHHQLQRIHAKRAGDRDEFHDVEPTLTAFVLGNKGLRFFQAKGEGMLGQPSCLARSNHKLAKGGLVGRMNGFADTAGARCHQPGKLIPSSDYPKKG
jgi:hypothetical protein